jgi:hypothetical protein
MATLPAFIESATFSTLQVINPTSTISEHNGSSEASSGFRFSSWPLEKFSHEDLHPVWFECTLVPVPLKLLHEHLT